MTREEFEKLVIEAIDELPGEFKEKLDNVDVTVAAWPNAYELSVAGLGRGRTLLGLYQGVPKTRRGSYYSALPDKITLFAGPILHLARTPEQIRAMVSRVVRHEIAHHFGMSEPKIRKAESGRG